MALLKEKLLVYKAAAVADGQLSHPCWIVNQWFLARYFFLFVFVLFSAVFLVDQAFVCFVLIWLCSLCGFRKFNEANF